MHGFQHAFDAMERADSRQDVGGIRPLGAAHFDPAPSFAGRQERLQQPLGSFVSEQPLVKIVQQGEVEAWVG